MVRWKKIRFKFLSGLSATNLLQLLIEMTMKVHIKYLNEIKNILRFRLYSGREDLEMASMFPGDMDNLVKII